MFPKMVVPPKHTKMVIFSRKTYGFVGETHHFRKPPYILFDFNLSFRELFVYETVEKDVRCQSQAADFPDLPS